MVIAIIALGVASLVLAILLFINSAQVADLERAERRLLDERLVAEEEVRSARLGLRDHESRLGRYTRTEWAVLDLNRREVHVSPLATLGSGPWSVHQPVSRGHDGFVTKNAARAAMYELLVQGPAMRLAVGRREVIEHEGDWEVAE